MKSVDANARITYANFVRSSVLLLQNTTKKNHQTMEWKIIPIQSSPIHHKKCTKARLFCYRALIF